MGSAMELESRHQCLIYDGPPSVHLRAVAAITREKLGQNYRCLYLNSEPMVAGMKSYLAAAGVDVARVIDKTSLVLSSEQGHLTGGRFDVDRMLSSLEDAFDQARNDGYAGLWATGDMTWELGPEKDFSRLLDYEWRLEEFFRTHLQMGGICQYHADTLPPEAVRQGLLAHRSLFVNQTLSLMNPYYVHPRCFTHAAARNPELEPVVMRLCQMET
jgi:hypothetical protein